MPTDVILLETFDQLDRVLQRESPVDRQYELAFLLEFMLKELTETHPEFPIEPKNLAHEFLLAKIDKRDADAAELESAILNLVRSAGPTDREKYPVMLFMVAPNAANNFHPLPDNPV